MHKKVFKALISGGVMNMMGSKKDSIQEGTWF